MSHKRSRTVDLSADLDAFVEAVLASRQFQDEHAIFEAGLNALRAAHPIAAAENEAGLATPTSGTTPDETGTGSAQAVSEALDAIARAQAMPPQAHVGPDWPIAGGQCGALIRRHAWHGTPVGSIDGWSPALRATVNNIVNSPIPKVLMWGREATLIYNDAYAVIAGPRHPQALGGATQHVWPEIWEWNREILAAGWRGEPVSHHDQALTVTRTGQPEAVVFDLYYTPVYDVDGQVGGVMCTVLENTKRVQAERELAQKESELLQLANTMPALVSYVDRHHVYRFANERYRHWLGVEPQQMIGQHARDVLGADLYEQRRPFVDRALAGETLIAEASLPHTQGPARRAEIHYMPRRDGSGTIVGVQAVTFDIEERVRQAEQLMLSNARFRAAETALREQAQTLARQVLQRERAEEQLRHLNETLEARVIAEIDNRRDAEAKLVQAQKMEAIGKLTGGVAHDFNNLLQIVGGNLQLLAKEIAGNERIERRVASAMAGVSRGAKLASQLLAFGRRQALEPKVVDVTRLVRGMDDMLRRAIGGGIEVETVCAGGLWNTFIDPVQIETALLNLAINARDAMEDTGKLTIEVSNAHLDDAYAAAHDDVSAGQYVLLAVSDTGCGMEPELVARAFDPFFSTKGEGKGSGLGLSMVWGFVKQSGGHVKIYSEPGEGTTVKLYLPRARQSEDREVEQEAGPISGGSETILVVEDDDEVRKIVVDMLTDLGYRVLKAQDAASALHVIDSGVAIDMLFTDVVMPGTLKSPELARKAIERLPRLAVLFTSGYTENSIVHGGRLDPGVELLSKPYPREALARKIRRVLNQAATRHAARAPDSPSSVSSAGSAAPDTHAAVRIVLVEDDALIRVGTAEMLIDSGYQVRTAGSAAQAVALVRDARADILLTDANLPDRSGLELIVAIRAIDPSIAVILASGDIGAIDARPDIVMLSKPYDLDDLLAALRVASTRLSDADDTGT